jgi:hypothetical protein
MVEIDAHDGLAGDDAVVAQDAAAFDAVGVVTIMAGSPG